MDQVQKMKSKITKDAGKKKNATSPTKKEFWREWKNKTPLEQRAIKSIRKAKRILFTKISKEEIHSIYLKGSFVRREMKEKSDVDFVPIVYDNKTLNPILKLQGEQKKELKPTELLPLSLWELKNRKRYHARKEKGPKGAPSIDEFVRFRLIWGKGLKVCDFPARRPEDRLRGLIKAWKTIFIPLYEKEVFTFDQIIKQVFWLAEYEQMVKGKPHTHSWKSLVASVKEKSHPVHDAWKLRSNPAKDKRTHSRFISKMKSHLKRLEKQYGKKEHAKKLGDLNIPVLGIGTFSMGGEYSADYGKDREHIKSIQQAIKLGFTHIDTAEKYGGGHTEELVGKAIKKYDRKKLFITTKVSEKNLGYDNVIKSAKSSLNRLGTQYTDLYLIHSPNPKIPIKETMKAMNHLVDKGLVKNIGVSSFNVAQLKEAKRYSKYKIVANELKYNIFAKTIDLKTIEWCQKNGILVIAYKVFGRGIINEKKNTVVSDLAKKYRKTDAQIILNWLASKKNVIVIFKASNTKHLQENKKSLDFNMRKDDYARLDALLNP